MMKAFIAVMAAVGFVGVATMGLAAADQPKSGESRPDNTPPEGFTALFNGKDLTGWKGLPVAEKLDNPIKRAEAPPELLAKAQKAADERMRAHWAVKDGVLVFDGKGDSLATARRLRRLRAVRRLEDREGRRQRHLPPRHAAGADLGPRPPDRRRRRLRRAVEQPEEPEGPRRSAPTSRSASGTRSGSRWSATRSG